MEFLRFFKRPPEFLKESLTRDERDILAGLNHAGNASYAEIFSALLDARTRRGEKIILPLDTVKIIDGLRERGLVERLEHPKFNHTDFWQPTERGELVLRDSFRAMQVSRR
ncbi:MAG: hypothetical protein Q8P25_02400 [Candidatus Curtissbacteria bacterium]|nr:hypothetical protein [Candidatus Curtissbacteria bacterium]